MEFFYYLIIGIVIYGVIVGVTDKGIFYKDNEDVFISFSPLIIIIITLILSSLLGSWFNYVGGIIFIVSVVYIIYTSFEYNKIFILSFSIGIAKIILSTVAALAAVIAISDHTSDGRYSSGYRDTDTTWLSTLIAGAVGFLIYKLINGDRVSQSIDDVISNQDYPRKEQPTVIANQNQLLQPKNNSITLLGAGHMAPPIVLPENTEVIVGRSDNVNVKLENKYVSGKHLSLRLNNNKIIVRDLGSTNGTYMEGKKLTPNMQYTLKSGERLIIGSEDVVYTL